MSALARLRVVTMQTVHRALFAFWLGLGPVAVVTPLQRSVPFLVFASIYANAAAHAAGAAASSSNCRCPCRHESGDDRDLGKRNCHGA